MPSGTRQSKLKQLEDLKRRVTKKPIGRMYNSKVPSRKSNPFKAKTDNPMGKDRVRDRKIKKLSQMMERRESLRKNTKPILPPRSRGTGGVNRGGFRKPDTSRIRPGILSNRKKVKKGS
jgi:hypothetical protein